MDEYFHRRSLIRTFQCGSTELEVRPVAEWSSFRGLNVCDKLFLFHPFTVSIYPGRQSAWLNHQPKSIWPTVNKQPTPNNPQITQRGFCCGRPNYEGALAQSTNIYAQVTHSAGQQSCNPLTFLDPANPGNKSLAVSVNGPVTHIMFAFGVQNIQYYSITAFLLGSQRMQRREL